MATVARELPPVQQFIPDELWNELDLLIQRFDPKDPGYSRNRGVRGPKRTPNRQILEAILYHTIHGIGWHSLPTCYPDDIVVYRWYRYWQQIRLLDRMMRRISTYYTEHGL